MYYIYKYINSVCYTFVHVIHIVQFVTFVHVVLIAVKTQRSEQGAPLCLHALVRRNLRRCSATELSRELCWKVFRMTFQKVLRKMFQKVFLLKMRMS